MSRVRHRGAVVPWTGQVSLPHDGTDQPNFAIVGPSARHKFRLAKWIMRLRADRY